jgi:hypothetical protein
MNKTHKNLYNKPLFATPDFILEVAFEIVSEFNQGKRLWDSEVEKACNLISIHQSNTFH